jgi:hypothetical protein
MTRVVVGCDDIPLLAASAHFLTVLQHALGLWLPVALMHRLPSPVDL